MSGLSQDDRATYEAHAGANYSTLKHYARSPAHAREQMLHPKEPTEAMEIGTAVHVAALEPERFGAEYVRSIKVDRRTKEGKAAWAEFEAEHAGKSILAPEDHESVRSMAAALRAHAIVGPLLSEPGMCEVSAYWTDNDTGAECKGRIDKLLGYAGESYVLDLKKTKDARASLFAAQIARLGYHVQAAWYLDGLDSIAPHRRRYVWIAVEEDSPHGIALYEPDETTLMQGRDECRQYLKTHLECLKSGVWPGYPTEVRMLTLPKWAVTVPEELR